MGPARHCPGHPIPIINLGIIIFSRISWYNHDINRRGMRVNKPWIEKTSIEDLKNSEFGFQAGGWALRAGGHDTVFCALRSFSPSKKDPPQADLAMP
jgi:hypothetical protein